MQKKSFAPEIILYLAGCVLIPVCVVFIRQQFLHEPPDEVDFLCRWGIFSGLLTAGFPGLISFYLFQNSRAAIRVCAPLAALLLSGVPLLVREMLQHLPLAGMILPGALIMLITFAAFLLHNRISVPTERLRSSRLILTLLTEFAVSGGIILLLCAIP